MEPRTRFTASMLMIVVACVAIALTPSATAALQPPQLDPDLVECNVWVRGHGFQAGLRSSDKTVCEPYAYCAPGSWCRP